MTAAAPICPVYLAAQQIRDLSDRQNSLESKAFDANRRGDIAAHGRYADEASRIYWAMIGVQHAAAFLRAEGALGVILQLGLMADEAEHLYSLVEPDKQDDHAEGKRTRDAIVQMAYSVAAFIERTCGVRREDIRAEYFLPHSHDSLKPMTAEAA